MTDITLRAVEPSDFDQWLKLYHGYAEHYKVTLTDDIIETTWGWLMDTSHPVHGLVAIRGGVLVGNNMGLVDGYVASGAWSGSYSWWCAGWIGTYPADAKPIARQICWISG